MNKAFNQYLPSEQKAIMKICYSWFREKMLWNEVLKEDTSFHFYQYAKSQYAAIQRHMEQNFTPDVIAACVSAYYARKLNNDKYIAHGWVAKQVERQWGKSFELWKKARRIEDLFYGLQDIPF